MKKNKNVPSGTGTFGTNGITLIALVITIIILVILAGVAIASLTGNGILGKVKQAGKEHLIEEARENLNLK